MYNNYFRMKNHIESNDNCLMQDYVPANVKVIEVTEQKVICTNAEPTFEKYQDGGAY